MIVSIGLVIQLSMDCMGWCIPEASSPAERDSSSPLMGDIRYYSVSNLNAGAFLQDSVVQFNLLYRIANLFFRVLQQR